MLYDLPSSFSSGIRSWMAVWQDLQTSRPCCISSLVKRFLNHLLLCTVRGMKWWKLWLSSTRHSSHSMVRRWILRA